MEHLKEAASLCTILFRAADNREYHEPIERKTTIRRMKDEANGETANTAANGMIRGRNWSLSEVEEGGTCSYRGGKYQQGLQDRGANERPTGAEWRRCSGNR